MRELTTIDCQYIQPQFAASYLISEGGRAAFVDNNTAYSVPILLRALEQKGISRQSVDWVIITHVHLDHAGGTGALMEACPSATLLAHPRAARHMTDPSRLIASAQAVYGKDEFRRMYGKIDPVSAQRVQVVGDAERVKWAGGELEFFHTRGHANHHFCISDPRLEAVFTGDAFGLAYPDLQKHGLFIFPSTSPTDFEPASARDSVKKIAHSGARIAYLTHFGGVEDLQGAASQLIRHLDFSESLLERAVGLSEPDAALDAFCLTEIQNYFRKILSEHKIDPTEKVWELLHLDLELNAAGIAYVAKKKRGGPPSGGA